MNYIAGNINPKKRILTALIGVNIFLVTLAHADEIVKLSEAESDYVARHIPILCVDPDWWPFEILNHKGDYEGIAADLHSLIRKRTGLSVKLFHAARWEKHLEASEKGECQLLGFVNESPTRSRWLIFTEPLLTDPNVLVTREDHPQIPDLKMIKGEKIALPTGSFIFERVSKEFPELKIIGTKTEDEAFELVSTRQADMTLRSLIVAGAVIKRNGWFNLKINSYLPGYENNLRIGVKKTEPLLRDVLNKGISTITVPEREQIINRHVEVKMVTDIDYTLVKWLLALIVTVTLTSWFWLLRLNKLNKNLEIALLDVQKIEFEQRNFISMLSHEIRSPLAVIDSTLQLIALHTQTNPTLSPLLNRIRRGVIRLSTFFDNSLTQDRLSSKSFMLKPISLDIVDLAKWEIEAAELLYLNKKFSLRADDKLQLYGDPALLKILISNLLSNAAKFSPAGGEVIVGLRSDETSCFLHVIDNGLGIAREDIPSIFNRFQRGQNVAGISGAGLGLSLIDRIVQLHNGKIYVESQRGCGTAILVVLPIHYAL